jgi:acetyltransferase-like isoleucine patch superfamily enzyme
MSVLRVALQIATMPLPWVLRRLVLNKILGFEIDPSASIGYSILDVKTLKMSEGSRIGHLTYAKGLAEIRLDKFSRIGNLNWITGFPSGDRRAFVTDIDRNPALSIGMHSAITHRHLIDCTDEVRIGTHSTIAGWRTQILTHGIDLTLSRQTSQPIDIGSYCFVGTGAILLKGSRLPNRSVLSAGSVLLTRESEECALYSGVPAQKVRNFSPDSAYFRRQEGFVT